MALTCDLNRRELVPDNCVLRKFITNEESKQCGELLKEVQLPRWISRVTNVIRKNYFPFSLTAFSNVIAFDWLLVTMQLCMILATGSLTLPAACAFLNWR